MGVLSSTPPGFGEEVSLFPCDPSGNLGEASADPSTGQDGPLLVAMLAQPLRGQNWKGKKKKKRDYKNEC